MTPADRELTITQRLEVAAAHRERPLAAACILWIGRRLILARRTQISTKRRARSTALLVSVLLHLLLLLILLVLPEPPLSVAIPTPNEEPIELVFAARERPRHLAPEQPESAVQPEPNEESPYISEKNTRAQDRMPGGMDELRPFSPGELPIPQLRRELSSPGRQQPNTPLTAPRADPLPGADRPALPAEDIPPGPKTLREQQTGSAQTQRPLLTLAADAANAVGEGDLSLSTYAWRWVPYMRALKDRIEKNLHPPPAFRQLGIIEGTTRLQFRIQLDGTVDGPRLLASSDHASLDQASMHSVRASAPLPPLPNDFPEDHLDIVFTYYYRVPQWARRSADR